MSERTVVRPESGIRVVLVGESAGVRRLDRTLSRGESVESVAAVTTVSAALDHVSSVDCLVSDPEHVASLRERTEVPIVSLATDDATPIAAGAVDVIAPNADLDVVQARVRNVVSAASGDRTGDRSQQLLDATTVVVALTTGDGTIEWVNSAVDRSLQYTPEELEGDPVESLVVTDDRAALAEARDAASRSTLDDVRRVSCRLRLGNGQVSRHPIDIRNRLADPTVNGLVWTIGPAETDAATTQPSTTDGTVAPAPELDRVDDPVLTLDDDWIVTDANAAARQSFSRDGASPIGFEFWELVDPETVSTWFERLSEASNRGSTLSFDVDRPDGDGIDSVSVYPAASSLTLFVRRRDESITTEYRTELDRTTGLLDEIAAPAFLVDDGRISSANEATLDYTERSTIVGRPLDTLVGDQLAETIRERATAPIRRVDPIDWRPTIDGRERIVELTVSTVEDRTAIVGRDVTRFRTLVDGVGALTDSFEAVQSASTVESTRRALVTGLVSAVDASVGVWYAREDDRLAPVSGVGTPDGGLPPPISMDDSRVSSLLSGGPARLDQTDRIPLTTDTVMADPIAVPIGETDVVFIGTAEPADRPFDDERTPAERSPATPPRLTALGSLVRGIAPIALSRATCRSETRELAASLERATAERDRMESLADGREAIFEALRTPETRSTLERVLCERVAGLTFVRTAWLVTGSPESVQIRSQAGDPPPSLAAPSRDALGVGGSASWPLARPVSHALESGTQVVEPIHTVLTEHDGGDVTGEEGTIIATPLPGTERQYGVLVVHVGHGPGNDLVSRFCGEVATVSSLALDVIDARRALLSDDTVELEVAIPTSEDDVLATLALAMSTTVELDAVIPGEDRLTWYVTVHSTGDSAPEREIEDLQTVQRVDRLQETDEEIRLEIVTDSHPFVAHVTAHGGVITSVTGRDGRTSMRIEHPADRDVRSVIESMQSVAPDVDLLARRPTSRHDPEPSSSTILAALTDRQRQILRTAYAAGYFEWPRERTGEEIATQLDISQPTFTRHFRAAERTIFEALFEATT